MRFKVNNKYVVDAKSHDDAIRVVKMLDAMEMYSIEQLDDAVKDADPDSNVDLDFLIKDEIEAIDGYRKMIAKTSNPQLLSVLSHILDEETEHVEELRAAQAGVYEVDVDDSIHDYRRVRYKGAKLIEAEEGIWMIEGFGETYASLDKAKKGVDEWISQGIHF